MASIFLNSLDFFSTQQNIQSAIAGLLAGKQYTAISPHVPIRFDLLLHKDKKGAHRHGGSAILTLPNEALGQLLLREYGGLRPQKVLHIGESRRAILFSPSKIPPRAATVGRLNKASRDPIPEKEQDPAYLRPDYVGIRKIQFGWECRDGVFSIEWETVMQDGLSSSTLKFNQDKREVQIEINWNNIQYMIAIRSSQISTISVHYSDEPVIFFYLTIPPMFLHDKGTTKRRLSALPWGDHHSVAPYTSQYLRLVCRSGGDLRRFSYQCRNNKRRTQDFVTSIAHRKLFSSSAINELSTWLRSIPWHVSFQLQGLVSAHAVDIREALELVPHIRDMLRDRGEEYTASFLRSFRPLALELLFSESGHNNILDFFKEQAKKYATMGSDRISASSQDDSSFECFHVIITPTRMRLDGPRLERSNRVIRTFAPEYHRSFLRVSFVDEDEVQYRFDRDVDGKTFLDDRVRSFLLQGLTLVGRKFEFLGYSQSALKEHTVWFIRPFTLEGTLINAQRIIKSIGKFDGLAFDKTLMYCPARYGARLSQAFTATDASLSVEAEEIIVKRDIKASGWIFTDGVGGISPDLALAIHKASHRRGRRRGGRARAAAIQIRLMGSKGMLAVDHTLSERLVILRDSMIKFEAPDSRIIEVARAFDSPGQYYLNRPLIMLLEGLGVRYEVFQRLQDQAVSTVKKASSLLHSAASLFEQHGLGSGFRVPSILYSLNRFGKDHMSSQFYRDVMLYATNHVLRELKQRARIPVPGAWTLVGVADVHNYLPGDTIYACVQQAGRSPLYLEGDILISRSPTIHPGDVQIVRAIGKPPPGSPYAIEKLANTVVFSVQGPRPVPSMLGGGDLDGDEYNLIPLDKYPEFRILAQEPAEYPPAKKKLLDHPSGLEDIADFVVEYINSDVLGLVAINWLVIADQDGIFDEKCLSLADLHSQAVDYQKSGQPVDPKLIPRPSMKAKPDWRAPETIDLSKATNYYPSERAIGKLFRAIDLPVIEEKRNRIHPRRHPDRRAAHESAMDMLSNMSLEDDYMEEFLSEIVKHYLGSDESSEESEEAVERLFNNYVYDLQSICSDNSLSAYNYVPLTEAEVVVGTIAQQTSQPKKRKKYTSNLREQTDSYLKIIRREFEQDEDRSWEDVLERGWAAWNLSQDRLKEKEFGAASFGWIALGVIFDAIREIEQEKGTRGTRGTR